LQSKTPLIVIANYTFDCVIQDAFHFKKDKLEEVQLGMRSRYKNFNVDKSLHLNDLKFNYHHADIEITDYYENPKLNEILKEYQEYFQGKETYFLMPLGAIQFFDTLMNLTHHNFFMISGDKGLALPDTFPLLGDQYDASYDGCYSYLVNFHAMGEYLKKHGGDCLLTQNDNDFKVNLFSMGTSFKDLTDTSAYFNNAMESSGPDEYCQFYDEFRTSSYRFDLTSLLAFIRFSKWDPNAYSIVHSRLLELIDDARKVQLEEIKRDLNKLKKNIFKMNIGDDVYNQIGLFYQLIGAYDIASELYQESITIYGDRAAPHNNLGMIFESQKNIGKALTHYQKSYELDKKNQHAFKKIHYLTGRPYLALMFPILKGVIVIAVM
jgi:tetratricopeptide (TPR) repeat protein